jgi:hypothetical protein
VTASGKQRAPGRMRSKKQWAFLFATHKPFAHRWAVATTGTPVHGTPQGKAAYGRLPRRKGAPRARSVR